MKLRAPAYPLITVDPYFSVWSMNDRLNGQPTRHWTGKDCPVQGVAQIDGQAYCFMGAPAASGAEEMPQTGVELDAFHTVYTFCAAGVRLTADFMTPLLIDDLEVLSRPVSYLRIQADSADGKVHSVQVAVTAGQYLCMDIMEDEPVRYGEAELGEGLAGMRMGVLEQTVLCRAGDDLRINWGYFYLAANQGRVCPENFQGGKSLCARAELRTDGGSSVLMLFAYDDIKSLVYFGEQLPSYWNRDGKTIAQAITEAYTQYDSLVERCGAFAAQMRRDAVEAGGEEYAQLLELAYRQVLAAHKLAVDGDGNLLYVSKECFSNGCAATVDISYPSSPLFLLYNPQLLEGMMRPIFRYAAADEWRFDFAPHDCGRYPILNGQVYSDGTDPQAQMPVEECGNMLVMVSALALVRQDASFLAEHRRTLDLWAGYLEKAGGDPDNQLCTDDFAGHLAHNCNLSLKAMVALAMYAKALSLTGDAAAAGYRRAAEEMASFWGKAAANGDGSYRLAFDRPGTFSMKYNLIWDPLFKLGLFDREVRQTETQSYLGRINAYGLPLDSRADYTKSDWLVWTAALSGDKAYFERMIHPLWLAYHNSPSRVPMTDWFSTVTSLQVSFQNRTVQGGLFMKLLLEKRK